MHSSMISHFYQEAHGNYKYKEFSLPCRLTDFFSPACYSFFSGNPYHVTEGGKKEFFLIELKDSCLPLLVTVAISICNCYKDLRKGVVVVVVVVFSLFLKCLTVHSVCFATDTVIVQF